MSRGKKVPVGERARAVGIAAVTSIAEAARQTGYSEPAIHKWFHSEDFEELRSRKTSVMEDEWRVGVQIAFRRSIELLASTEDPVKAATTGAIIFDKLALATGQATSRTESRSLTDDYDDEEKARLRDFIDKLDDPDSFGKPGEPAADPQGAGSEVR